jgi:YYY domain-containing protein
MTAFFSWYLLISILGWITFPFAFVLFPALVDRGYSLSRALGLLFAAYFFWLLGSFGIAQNDLGGISLALAILVGLSLWGYSKLKASGSHEAGSSANLQQPIQDWFWQKKKYLLIVEVLFFTAFALMAFIRSANPELTTAEKPMELAFINAILRSQGFPPHDPWLSGYAISYYYFGYVMTAMLARLSGIPGSQAHNLMTALIFGLAAIGSYGILFNLLAQRAPGGGEKPDPSQSSSSIVGLSFLAPLFLLIVSNLEAVLEVLYRLGIFWPRSTNAGFNFWTWLDMRELTTAPPQPGAWMPDRYLWWWRASRVVQDYDLAGNFREVIDEFPFFSFLHADLHPHVLAIPFGLIAIAAALHIFLGGWRGSLSLLGAKLNISASGFLLSAFILGGLAFLNTWDILIATGLIVCAYLLAQANRDGWGWRLVEEFVLLGLLLGVCAFILYMPFYFGFSSQAGGLLPNLINPTRGAHLWVMFGSLLLPILAWMIYSWKTEIGNWNWKAGALISISLVLALWILSWLLGSLMNLVDPALSQGFLFSQGVPDLRSLFVQATARRISYLASLVTLLAVLMPSLAWLLKKRDPPEIAEVDPKTSHSTVPTKIPSHYRFVLLLTILGALLVLAPEFVYLRDQFGTRLNTVFKFYYQAWILWSFAAAYGTAVLLQKLRGRWSLVFSIGLALLLFAGLLYPSLSLMTKSNNFKPTFGFSLDDFDRLQRETPDDGAAIQWLLSAPDGVVAEAVGGSYSGFGRVSTYSGLPTVLGWPGHESQWRGGAAEQGSRREDIETLYTAPNWSSALAIIEKYNIRYIFMGSLEHSTLIVQEEKFKQHLQVAFQQGNTVIYEVP